MANEVQTSRLTTTVFALDEDWDLPASGFSMLTGAAAVAQDLKARLQFFRGESFLDPSTGVPFFQRLLGKPVSEAAVRNEIRAAIEASPDIARIESITTNFDRGGRALSVAFRAITLDGETVEAAVTVP